VARSVSVSRLEDAIVEYLAVRRALGFRLEGVERWLREFVAFLDRRGEQQITINAAVAWAVLPGGSDSLHYRRLATVRLFAEYLRGVDPSVEIPGVEILRNGPARRRPFLYTDEEILALMQAAESLKTSHRRATYQTLIGLLASTGMRVGEAIALDLGDFDARLGLLVVRGKRSKVRELPLAPSTSEALRTYLQRRDRPPGRVATRALFVGIWGTRLEASCVEETFSVLRERAGIQERFGCRPTLHGLRHTFAIRTMLDAYHQEVDAGARLGVLSTYLGHVDPANSYWYLQAVPELMSAAATRLEQHEEQQQWPTSRRPCKRISPTG
jgi:integrase